MSKKLYKSTIVVWSQFDPQRKEMDIDELADIATSGEAYCSSYETVRVEELQDDPDYDGSEFFDAMEVESDEDLEEESDEDSLFDENEDENDAD
jgi:hypothetical protein